MLKYNIEVAHIYIDQPHIANEQIQSLDLINVLFKDGQVGTVARDDISVGVWLDDYNPTYQKLDVLSYSSEIEKTFKIDYICSEDLVSRQYVPIFRNILNQKAIDYYDEYLLRMNKLPCSLVTSMWYAIRLGIFKPIFSIARQEKVFNENKFVADKIFNILPKKFANSEKKVIKIYQENTKLTPYIFKIRNIFF